MVYNSKGQLKKWLKFSYFLGVRKQHKITTLQHYNITTKTARAARGDNPARPPIRAPTSATFKITYTKLYMPVVILSTKDDNNFLEQLKSGFKRYK